MVNYEELTIQELRAYAKEKNIELLKNDSKVIIIDRLKQAKTKEIQRTNKIVNVRRRMQNKNKVIVTKLNPDDTIRDSVIVTIINATGNYTAAVPFNVQVSLPEPIIKNLKNAKYQGWIKRKIPSVGTMDAPMMLPAYNVQYVD